MYSQIFYILRSQQSYLCSYYEFTTFVVYIFQLNFVVLSDLERVFLHFEMNFTTKVYLCTGCHYVYLGLFTMVFFHRLHTEPFCRSESENRLLKVKLML